MKLWKQIVDELLTEISVGKWPVGSKLPSELELSKKFDVSRDTIRKALKALEKADFIERRPHIGTRIKSKARSGRFLHEMSDVRKLFEYGHQYPRRIQKISEITADPKLAETIFGINPGTKLIKFENVRVASDSIDEVVVVTNVYVSSKASVIVGEARRRPKALIANLVEEYFSIEYVEVRQTFSASAMPEAVATYFKCAPGTPCLKIVRSYLDKNGRIVSASESFHQPDRIAFTISQKKRTIDNIFL